MQILSFKKIKSANKKQNIVANWNRAPVLTLGFEIFGRYNFPNMPSLGIQGDLILLFNNGGTLKTKVKSKKTSMTAVYDSLEFPIFAIYDINKGPVSFSFNAGPDFIIPLSKMRETEDDGTTIEKYNSEILNKFVLGVICGAEIRFSVGETIFNVCLQFESDLSPMKIKYPNSSEEVLAYTRRGLRLSVGSEYKL